MVVVVVVMAVVMIMFVIVIVRVAVIVGMRRTQGTSSYLAAGWRAGSMGAAKLRRSRVGASAAPRR